MDVVVVESPAKAKTINKYLGDGYVVLPSVGHVRDLKEKDGAVEPDRDFAMHWVVDGRGADVIKTIGAAARKAKRLYLATDPDREGEAISWHVSELLRESGATAGVEVKRVVFNEITKRAVTEAMKAPRELDRPLIDAYLARRALDFLVGFNLSPVLWRKLPGSRSAGRVQSVALRLVCERELEIETFKPQEYWTIEAELKTAAGDVFAARLVALDGKKLDKFAFPNEAAAQAAKARLEAASYRVASVETKRVRRNPPPPFTTSTLQQEASRKLRFGARRTMQLAQRLYEGENIGGETVGLITYMRTDGVSMAQEAISAIRGHVGAEYGQNYLPGSPRLYQNKSKNAQEAHEAVRPTDVSRRPEDMRRYLEADEAALYDLIWKRAVASQMESAVFDQATIDVESQDGGIGLRATGSVPVFDGFLRLYQEGRDDDGDEKDARLPPVEKGAALGKGEVKAEQHFTEPPPRYSEASLVKRLEELGIGRPSTYASILSVLQDRGYVRLEKGRFFAEDSGRVVTAFLIGFFKHYVEYDFTAAMEEKLDDIADGKVEWRAVLRDFWRDFFAAVEEAKGLRVSAVIDWLDKDLEPHVFAERADGTDPRKCPRCDGGRLGIKLSRNGPFVGCSNYPACKFTKSMSANGAQGAMAALDGKELGKDPVSGDAVVVKNGRFGPYLQLGEGEKPKRASIPRDVQPDAVTLELALKLLALPREIGIHTESQKPVLAGLGRFGPYLLHDGKYARLASTDEALSIGINDAVIRLAQPKRGRGGQPRGAPKALRELGNHPANGKPITVHDGKYGPYVKNGALNATIPKSLGPEGVTLDQAVELLAARAAKVGAKAGKGASKNAGEAKPKAKKSRAKAKPAPETA